MKSRRKNNGWLCPLLHEQLKDVLYFAKPNQALWYRSEELNQVLIKMGIIDSTVGCQRLGAYLTAAGFVRKDFYVLRHQLPDAHETDHTSKKIRKWRVGIYGI